MPLHNRARPAPTLDERMGRGTFPPQGGGGKRQEASPATGKKARRKVFGMTMKRYLNDFGQRPCGGTARRQIGRPLPAVPRGGNKKLKPAKPLTAAAERGAPAERSEGTIKARRDKTFCIEAEERLSLRERGPEL